MVPKLASLPSPRWHNLAALLVIPSATVIFLHTYFPLEKLKHLPPTPHPHATYYGFL